ncbi:hypothetical protein [Roseobacter sp. GAI101]|uniref:hypothetical protein n=1 Tax=Roseobacter sp. (strain GAI101) TaxID=391589 RepID=UPI0002F7F42A|nr:hypothetical protein [Roseobacter sp. GAI101]
MLKIATGASEETDTVEAVEEALEIALEGMDGVKPKAGLAFVGIDVDVAALVKAFSEACRVLNWLAARPMVKLPAPRGSLKTAS